MKTPVLIAVTFSFLLIVRAQISTGSDGSDGPLSPVADLVINMADHPTGIYNYTSVNIPAGVAVTFVPNANNTPVFWLVQNDVVINGTVDVSGQSVNRAQCCNAIGAKGGPGGWSGGPGGVAAGGGQGLGGGQSRTEGGNASYGTLGTVNDNVALPPGPVYGNPFLIPLLGGSGGGGASGFSGAGGGGGGGAILIAVGGNLTFNGSIASRGGAGGYGPANCDTLGGGGSGGAIRLVAAKIAGSGGIYVLGGLGSGNGCSGIGGSGRVRFDSYQNDFAGIISGSFTRGSQFTLIPAPGSIPQLRVTTVGGVSVSASPTGQLSTPDALVSAQQNNPIPVTVVCNNVPLGSQITVTVKPANGAAVSATGANSAGTIGSSTATIPINIPRGGGLIYATAATAP